MIAWLSDPVFATFRRISFHIRVHGGNASGSRWSHFRRKQLKVKE
jgi:hypothetical protein